MALASQIALLDELMGKNRDATGSDAMKGPHWSDEDNCRSFLCGFCPHDLFVNTKTDLGPCDKIHDERLRVKYKKSDRFETVGYEEEFYRYLCYLLEEVDKRIRRGHDRLSSVKVTTPADPDAAAEKVDKIASLTRRINELVEQAEQLGTEGNVDQAQGTLKICEQLKNERSNLEGDSRPGGGQELEVCEICGAFRIKDDAPQRVEEHLAGKMHLGYAKIRDYVREYDEKRLRAREKEREAKVSRQRERLRSPERVREHRHRDKRHRSGSRHRSGHIDKKRGDRSRSRSRKRLDHHNRHKNERSTHRPSKRTVSPFSAARRPPEGAEDD